MARKRAKLTNIEVFYVENHRDVPHEVLAEELGVSVNSIKKVLDKKVLDNKDPVVETEPKPEVTNQEAPGPDIKAKDLFGRKSAGGRQGVVIMTEAASMRGDAHRDNAVVGRDLNTKFKDAIFRQPEENK